MYQLVESLYPICRSITGEGVRQTLRQLGQHIPLEIHQIPTGTPVFDWTVPKEWNVRDAYVKNARGNRVIDFQKSNLHLLNYSIPVKAHLTLSELKEHLFTLPDHPDWVPYRTTYYSERWGFCLSQNQFTELADGEYEVCVESSLADGFLNYGECYIPGEQEKEILFSCHVCHPSLANDNLSGIALAACLARSILNGPRRRYSYRFLFIPGTIGSITWLALNESHTARIKHGLVLSCVGDSGPCTYKKSRRGNAEVDRAAAHVLRCSGEAHQILEFKPYGYDERQFCSPGFNLPVGCFMRTPNGCYPEYHTSADNLELVRPECLANSFGNVRSILAVLEGNGFWLNQNPKCEPQLGKRGLYKSLGGTQDSKSLEMALLWVLNLSDGDSDLLGIAERAGLKFETVKAAADLLERNGLLQPIRK
jgi:aminopeptidase-like protein